MRMRLAEDESSTRGGVGRAFAVTPPSAFARLKPKALRKTAASLHVQSSLGYFSTSARRTARARRAPGESPRKADGAPSAS